MRKWQALHSTHFVPDSKVGPGVVLVLLHMLPLHCIHISIGACGCDHVTTM